MSIPGSIRLVEAVCPVVGGGIGSGRLEADGVVEGVAGIAAWDSFAGVLEDVPEGTDILPGEEMLSDGRLVETLGDLPAFVPAQAATTIEHAIAKATRKYTAVPGAALFAGLTAVPAFLYELFMY